MTAQMAALHIACATDDHYAAYCATMLQSVLSRHRGEGVVVHLLHGAELDGALLAALGALATRHGARLSPLTVDAAAIAGLPRMARIPPIMWLRVMLPELLPEVSRVLYLDVDTLALRRLDELWSFPLGDGLVAAVDNVLERAMAGRPAALGLDPSAGYFNSGVLLMNLVRMREEGTAGKLLDTARQRGAELLWPDQDALNIVVGARRRSLHPRWNCQNSFFYWRQRSIEVLGQVALDESVAAPAILHFEGPLWAKPWHYLNDHPYRDAWLAHQSATGWAMPPLDGKTLKNLVIRHLPRRVAHWLGLARPQPHPSHAAYDSSIHS